MSSCVTVGLTSAARSSRWRRFRPTTRLWRRRKRMIWMRTTTSSRTSPQTTTHLWHLLTNSGSSSIDWQFFSHFYNSYHLLPNKLKDYVTFYAWIPQNRLINCTSSVTFFSISFTAWQTSLWSWQRFIGFFTVTMTFNVIIWTFELFYSN